MQSKANTVAAYLAELPADRRGAIEAVRRVMRENIDAGFEEGMQYGMIGYYVPHRTYPAGYHCDPKQPLPFASLASQKNYMSLYGMCLYENSELLAKFQKAWAKTGKKLDMGKCCIRFKKLDDLALDVIADLLKSVTMQSFIAYYESAIRENSKTAAAKKVAKKATKKVVKKPVKKAPPTKKAVKMKTPAKTAKRAR